MIYNIKSYEITLTAAVALSVRAFASQTKGWVIESQPLKTQVAKTGSDSSTAKNSALVRVSRVLAWDRYKRMTRVTVMWHAKKPSLISGHDCLA